MARPSLPPGRFRDAVIQRGYGILNWVLVWFIVLIVILFTPWERLFEGEDKPGLAMRAWQVVSRGEPIEMWPFAFLFFGVLILIGLYGLWRGLVSAFSPRNSGPARALAKIGAPDRVLASFETEARDPVIDIARPRILITRSWLMFGDSMQVELLPLEKVAWAYGKQGKTGHMVAGFLGMAGAINARQRELATQFDDPDELDLILHVRDADDPVVLNVKGALDEVLDHLVRHAPHMVVGHEDFLADLWKADRETFIRKGRALGGVQAPAARPTETPPVRTLFGDGIPSDQPPG